MSPSIEEANVLGDRGAAEPKRVQVREGRGTADGAEELGKGTRDREGLRDEVIKEYAFLKSSFLCIFGPVVRFCL